MSFDVSCRNVKCELEPGEVKGYLVSWKHRGDDAKYTDCVGGGGEQLPRYNSFSLFFFHIQYK